MYVWSTNPQGPHSIPQFLVALNEALPFYPMSGVQHCYLRVILSPQDREVRKTHLSLRC